MTHALKTFPLFSSLPLEIRRKIWFHSLPGPRTLLLGLNTTPTPSTATQKRLRSVLRSRRPKSSTKYVAAPASYGGHQPSILSVNGESRAEALQYLTPLFDAYWNLEIDTAYFELPQGDNSKEEVTLIREMREAGYLSVFKHIAIDWMLWWWESSTKTMEFQVTFKNRFTNRYEHPITTLNELPNLKTCIFVHTSHTMQKDLVTPYVAWELGHLSLETTLDGSWKSVETGAWKEINRRKIEIENNPDLDIRFLSIHNRAREYLPPDKLKRPQAGWEMDWFG